MREKLVPPPFYLKGPTVPRAQPHPDKYETPQPERGRQLAASPADRKPWHHRRPSDPFSRSEKSEQSCSGPERRGRGGVCGGLMTGGCTSGSPLFLFFLTDCLWAGAAHATLLRRVLSPLRQNPVCLSDNLICPTQPGLKRAMVVLLLLLVYFGKWKSEKLPALGRSCRWRSLKKKKKNMPGDGSFSSKRCARAFITQLCSDFTDKKPPLIWQYVARNVSCNLIQIKKSEMLNDYHSCN